MEHTAALPKSFLAFYDTPKEVEDAIVKLQKNKCDIGKLSIVAIDLSTYQTNVKRIDVCRMSYWALEGSVFGLLIGSSVFFAFSVKPLFKLGIVNTILILLEMAVIGAMVTILIAMRSQGRSRLKSFSRNKFKMKAGKYLILSKSNDDEIEIQRKILKIKSIIA